MQRANEWAAIRRAALLEIVEADDRLDLTFEASPDTEAELRRLVVAERSCCAHDAIAWDLIDHGDQLTVRVTVSAALDANDEVATIVAALTGEERG